MHCRCEADRCPHAAVARREAWEGVYAAVREALSIQHLPMNDRIVLGRIFRAAATLAGVPVLRAAGTEGAGPASDS